MSIAFFPDFEKLIRKLSFCYLLDACCTRDGNWSGRPAGRVAGRVEILRLAGRVEILRPAGQAG